MVTAPYRNLIADARTADVDPRTLRPHPHNWRQHPDQQRAAMNGLLEEIGWVQRILVSEASDYIVNGHLRVELALARGDATVPVEFVPGLTPEQEDLLLVAFDTVTTLHGTDDDLLRTILQSIQTSNESVTALLDYIGQTYLPAIPKDRTDDPGARLEEMEALREGFGVELGQLWLCGPHRLLCGDATDPASAARLFGDARPHLMVTDPPYGVNYDPTWREGANRVGKVTNDDRASWLDAWRLFPGAVAYVWHGGLHAAVVAQDLESAGFELRSQIIWDKGRLVLSRGHYHWEHEPCWYGVRGGRAASWAGDRTQTTMWRFPSVRPGSEADEGDTPHGTQKPLEAMARPIRNHLSDEVYDPFVGSGTTLVAAEQEGRTGYAMELDPGYVAVSVDRLQRMGLDVRREDGVA